MAIAGSAVGRSNERGPADAAVCHTATSLFLTSTLSRTDESHHLCLGAGMLISSKCLEAQALIRAEEIEALLWPITTPKVLA